MERLGQMSYVEFGSGGLYQLVIYIHLHGRSYLLLEHSVHQPLISSSCVLEPKRYHTIAIGSLPCDERGLFLVIWVHADLVVAGEDIHKIEEFMARCHDEVDSRQWEAVFWACSVDVSEVDAESPLAVRFFDKYDVSQLFRVFHFSDCSCLEEFTNLLVDRFFPFWREAPPLLLDWLKGRANVQPMSDYCGVNSSHVRLLPREDVFVLSQEMGKGVSEVLRKIGADVGEVFRVVVQRYRLQLFRGLRSSVHLVVHVELVQVYVIDRFSLHGC